jgi:NAD-dependent dihydropyrimidine dehydrogenase PreA subunit
MLRDDLQFDTNPVPIIDLDRCNGCGLCVLACPTRALAIQEGKAMVAHPEICDYTGLCVMICPLQAIQLCFEIVILDNLDRKSIKVEDK